jgi:tRNA(fMet)-specific endonuclease VapC
MNMVLLDTNIVSYLFKGDTRATAYSPHLLNQELAISMMTVAELFQWAGMRDWGNARIAELETLLQSYTILPDDMETCRKWAEVRVERYKLGHPIAPQDAWIAATALRYGLVLITHNPNDFQKISGLAVISEVK